MRKRFRDTVCRAHNPEWAWTPLSGEGARRYGRRFNMRGRSALCCSPSQVTAIREATPLGSPMQPLTLYTHEVDAEPVFDAADPMQLRQLEEVDALVVLCFVDTPSNKPQDPQYR